MKRFLDTKGIETNVSWVKDGKLIKITPTVKMQADYDI